MSEKCDIENRHRVYANNAPRILLEVLSARTTLVILATTYIVFILAFVYDVGDTVHNFGGADRHLQTSSCSYHNIDMDSAWNTDGEWGCTIDNEDKSKVWVGRVNNVSNVISVSLKFVKHNISSINFNGTEILVDYKTTKEMYLSQLQSYSMKYHISLYACHQRNGCSRHGSMMENMWQSVLTKNHQRIYADSLMSEDMRDMELSIFGNTFQNQEALPTKSNIKSYLMFVKYSGDFSLQGHSDQSIYTNQLVSNPYMISGQEEFFEFMSIQRPRSTIGDVMRPILMAITFIMALYYVKTLYDHNPNPRKWLHERKWVLFYFFVLLIYQNPVYCVICRVKSPSSFWVFTSYALDAFAQASFFLIWLLFADGMRRQSFYYRFYVPKVIIAMLIFGTNMAILVMQFPTVNTSTVRTPALAVYNWSKDTKVMFIAFSLSFFSLLILWSLWWFSSLWSTAIVLRKVPYMTTRYLQLSFRFFALQASFVATYYILEYGVVIFLILRNSPPVLTQHYYNIADNINTLFRHQTLLVGKVLFLSVYSLILAFLFLPANHMDSGDSLQTLATTYTITEEELESVTRIRKKAIKSTKGLSNLTQAKSDVYCVSLAQQMLDASWEVYYDLIGTQTASGFGPADWERHGYKVIDHSYDPEFDAYCCIVRHLRTNRIVVAFRGSCSARHWHNNLQYGLKAVDLNSLYMPNIDDGDGMDVSQYIDLNADGLDHEETLPTFTSPFGNTTSDPMSIMTGTLRGVMGATKEVVVGATSTVVGATTTVVDATTDILTAAVAHTPGINRTVKTYVHSGFWDTYFVLREFIHRTLRFELRENPGQVIFTGHSLGGAMATFAALDFSIHSLIRINKYIRHKKITRTLHPIRDRPMMGGLSDVTVANYTFGAPKNGNWMFAKLYDKLVPNTFRTVVDGDIVVGLPPTWSYVPCGTEVLVDPKGAGSIIIDPSFVERRLRTSVKSSISVHAMTVYKLGIDGVYDAAVFLQRQAMSAHDGQFDSVRLALVSRPLRSDTTGSSFEALPSDSWHGNVSLRPFEVLKQEPFRRGYERSVQSLSHESKSSSDEKERPYAEEWGYEMDATSSYGDQSVDNDVERSLPFSTTAPPSRFNFTQSSSPRSDSLDCDRLDEFSRMALSVEMENEGASFSPLLDLTLTHAKQAISLVATVPLSILQNVLIRTGLQAMDDQEIEDVMSATVPRRSEVSPNAPLESTAGLSSSTKQQAGVFNSSPPPSE